MDSFAAVVEPASFAVLVVVVTVAAVVVAVRQFCAADIRVSDGDLAYKRMHLILQYFYSFAWRQLAAAFVAFCTWTDPCSSKGATKGVVVAAAVVQKFVVEQGILSMENSSCNLFHRAFVATFPRFPTVCCY